MTQRIWITYHKDEQVKQYGLEEDNVHKLFAAHKDPEKENINYLNPVYSEMVTMWYVWKNNLKSDYVSFQHYRRRFDIKRLPNNGECHVYRIVDFKFETVYEQYARCHNSKDMDVALRLLDEIYGENNPYSDHIRNRHWLISNCCFTMKWADFVKMCNFLFPLLDSFAAACGISNTNVGEWRKKAIRDFGDNERTVYNTRIVSFIAERLISAWIDAHLTPYIDGRNVAIVHYNTPKLLEAAIRSLRKNSPGSQVYIFDNSDKKPFKKKLPNVKVFDNTKGQIVDFGRELEKHPDRLILDEKASNFGSAKHTMSVDKLMELIPNGFVLMDSDVLVKQCLNDFWDCKCACAGTEGIKQNVPFLKPFLCWINVPLLKEKNVRYYSSDKMWALTTKIPNRFYDTGAAFLEEVRRYGLSIGRIDIDRYIIHFGHGSWKGNEESIDEWLKENCKLWQ